MEYLLNEYKQSLDIIHSDYYCSLIDLKFALKEKNDNELDITHISLIKNKLFDIPTELCSKDNIELLYKVIDNICNSYHKFLTLNTLKYYNKNNISFISRYDTLCPIQNPIYLNIQGNKYVYNASKIQFNNSNFLYYPSQCPIFDGYKMPDIDLFLKMLIDNDIKTICIPITFEPSKTFKWFPTNKTIIRKYTTKILAEQYEDLRDHLLKIHNNIKDLIIPFRSRMYYNKQMEGSYSIKKVLPALFPDNIELNYHNLPIVHNGSEASGLYLDMKEKSKEEQKKIRQGLLKYCELDTYAMVKIWEKLKEAVGEK